VPQTGFLAELQERQLLAQPIDAELGEHLDSGRRTLYCGFDPTADSLHLGNLVPMCGLRRFLKAGHRVVAVVGGGTGMVGDPSGKDSERNLLGPDELAKNVAGIRAQLERFFGSEVVEIGDPKAATADALIVDNSTWLAKLNYLDFLRDIGKHFTVNQMIGKDSVKARLDRGDQGISYTEFSYMLLQAYDYLQLFDMVDCTLQLGATDQWGNISEGISLIRRMRSAKAYAAVFPLVTKADGTKFGKSVGGAMWLDADRTSPYDLHQFLLQTEDTKVVEYLRTFTWLSLDEIGELEIDLERHPEKRAAQHRLADEVVTLVHGDNETAKANQAAKTAFTVNVDDMSESDIKQMMATTKSVEANEGALALSVLPGLFEQSNSAVRRTAEQGGLYINGERATSLEIPLERSAARFDRYFVVKLGKKNTAIVDLGPLK